MIIVNLKGGLGNQMFQYAFAKACEEASKEKVFFDMNWFRTSKKYIVNDKNETASGMVVRDYALDIFNLELPMIPNNKYKSNIISDKYYCQYNPSFLRKKDGYFDGYFQNEKYFKKISTIIKKDFELPNFNPTDTFNNDLLSQINNTNSIMLHIRHGDYANLGIQIDIEYYKKAVDYIESKVKDPIFFIFGQTKQEFIEEIFKDKNSKYIIIGDTNYNNKEDWKDFKLMIECKHSIIANSSFSWWATWLKEYEGKITVAPTPWLHEIDEIIPDRWHKINLNKG